MNQSYSCPLTRSILDPVVYAASMNEWLVYGVLSLKITKTVKKLAGLKEHPAEVMILGANPSLEKPTAWNSSISWHLRRFLRMYRYILWAQLICCHALLR